MRKEGLEPFEMVHHDDNSWSLILKMDDDALRLFSVDPDELELEEDFELDGYYWDALVKCYLQTGRVNESDLRLFAQSFKEACADPLCLEEMLRGFGEYLD